MSPELLLFQLRKNGELVLQMLGPEARTSFRASAPADVLPLQASWQRPGGLSREVLADGEGVMHLDALMGRLEEVVSPDTEYVVVAWLSGRSPDVLGEGVGSVAGLGKFVPQLLRDLLNVGVDDVIVLEPGSRMAILIDRDDVDYPNNLTMSRFIVNESDGTLGQNH